jgi:hypothetical protein
VCEVLAVAIHEDATVIAHVLRVPTAEVGVKKCVWHAPERLHGRLESIAADVEFDAAFVRLSVRVHSGDFSP